MSNSFREEFQRLMRALNDSLERESELQRQLRRTKESLVSVALRLQVAIKVSREDELTIASLQNQTTDARTKELLSNSRAHEAADIINTLNIEISTLKRKLKAFADSEKVNQQAQSTMNNHFANELADYEVDEMMANQDSDRIVPITNAALFESKPPPTATPFERWKMNHFIYSPDTPAASEAHDKHVVDMLLEAATAEFDDCGIHRPTKSGIAKMKRTNSSTGLRPLQTFNGSSDSNTRSSGANQFEGLSLDVLKDPKQLHNIITSSSPYLNTATQQQQHQLSDKTFFLSQSDPHPMWGQKQRFNSSDAGRMNLWATNHNSALGGLPPASAAGVASTISPNKQLLQRKTTATTAAGSAVKLKSIRKVHDSTAAVAVVDSSNDAYTGPHSKYDRLVNSKQQQQHSRSKKLDEGINKVYV